MGTHQVLVPNVLITKDLSVVRKLVSDAATPSESDINRIVSGKEDSYLFNGTGESPLLHFSHTFNLGDGGPNAPLITIEFVDPKDDLIKFFRPSETKMDWSELIIPTIKAPNTDDSSFNPLEQGFLTQEHYDSLKIYELISGEDKLKDVNIITDDEMTHLHSKYLLSDWFNEIRTQLNAFGSFTNIKNSSISAKKLYVTYGVGGDIRQWVGPYVCAITGAEFDYSGEGAKILKLRLVPDIVKNLHTKEDRAITGRVALDWEGFGIFAAGRTKLVANKEEFFNGKPEKRLSVDELREFKKQIQLAAEFAVHQYIAQITFSRVLGNITVVLPDITPPDIAPRGKSGGLLYSLLNPRSWSHPSATRVHYLGATIQWLRDLGFEIRASAKNLETRSMGPRAEEAAEDELDIGFDIMVSNRFNSEENTDGELFAHVTHREWQHRLNVLSGNITRHLKNTKGTPHTSAYTLFAENDIGLLRIWKKYGLIESDEDPVMFYGDPALIMPFYYLSQGPDLKTLSETLWPHRKETFQNFFGRKFDNYVREITEYLYPSNRQLEYGISQLPSVDEFAETGQGALKEVQTYLDKKSSTGIVTPIFKLGTKNPNITNLTILEKTFIWRFLNILPFSTGSHLGSLGGGVDLPDEALSFSKVTLTNLFNKIDNLYGTNTEEEIRQHLNVIIGPHVEGWEDTREPPTYVDQTSMQKVGEVFDTVQNAILGMGISFKDLWKAEGYDPSELVEHTIPTPENFSGAKFSDSMAKIIVEKFLELYLNWKQNKGIPEYTAMKMPVSTDDPTADLLYWYKALSKEPIKIKIETPPFFWIGHQYTVGYEYAEPAYLFLREIPVTYNEREDLASDISRKLFSGLYNIIGFKHIISGSDAHSEFVLIRGSHTLTKKDAEETKVT